ncbi:hypothetical protein C2S52_014544 [Perilla frutescens var. hirtella]|nr:hypothetical protein C2S52_014544 [Perilla frutescens var. hirtella]
MEMEDQHKIAKDKNVAVYFLELMKSEQLESKLWLFFFKIKFHFKVSDLRSSVNVVKSLCEEILNSSKLTEFMVKAFYVGNAFGWASRRDACVGFKLDRLSQLTETKKPNNITEMHYLCKYFAIENPEILDFPKDLVNLKAASKIELKSLAEDIEGLSYGLEKAKQELAVAENDDPFFENLQNTVKEFVAAEAELSSIKDLYNIVVKNADKVVYHFGENPVNCSLEKVVTTLVEVVEAMKKACEEYITLVEQERQRAAMEIIEAYKGVRYHNEISQQMKNKNEIGKNSNKVRKLQKWGFLLIDGLRIFGLTICAKFK